MYRVNSGVGQLTIQHKRRLLEEGDVFSVPLGKFIYFLKRLHIYCLEQCIWEILLSSVLMYNKDLNNLLIHSYFRLVVTLKGICNESSYSETSLSLERDSL